MLSFVFGVAFGCCLGSAISALRNKEEFMGVVQRIGPDFSPATQALLAVLFVAIIPFWNLYMLCVGEDEK